MQIRAGVLETRWLSVLRRRSSKAANTDAEEEGGIEALISLTAPMHP